jgi:diadenylate cyclase
MRRRRTEVVGTVSKPDETPLGGDPELVAQHSTVDSLINRLIDVAESLSVEFDRWEEQYVSGPSLYVVVLADANYGQYADPLGTNTWPTDTARVIPESPEAFVMAAEEVSFSQDGAVIVTVDGTIQRQMVRIRSPSAEEVERREEIDYADWMGTKHLSAVEVSTREEVLAAVTLSEENGRVTVFRGGSYEDRERDELGGRWRADR